MSPNAEAVDIESDRDLLAARQLLRRLGRDAGFSGLELTRLLTAFSELGRNVIRHADNGRLFAEVVSDDTRVGVLVVVEDRGSGIANIGRAMEDGFSTKEGLGLGLGGVKRLASEFELKSEVDAGTTVRATFWRRG